jgi:hypothetical protein
MNLTSISPVSLPLQHNRGHQPLNLGGLELLLLTLYKLFIYHQTNFVSAPALVFHVVLSPAPRAGSDYSLILFFSLGNNKFVEFIDLAMIFFFLLMLFVNKKEGIPMPDLEPSQKFNYSCGSSRKFRLIVTPALHNTSRGTF